MKFTIKDEANIAEEVFQALRSYRRSSIEKLDALLDFQLVAQKL